MFQTEKALQDVGDKISESEKSEVQAQLTNVKDILERTKDKEMSDSELDELKAAKEKLMNSAQQLFTKMYEQSQAAGGAAGAGPDMSGAFSGGQAAGFNPNDFAKGNDNASGGNNDGDVVDGEFREV